MALGTTLSELVRMVREEAGHSTNPAVGSQTADPIRQRIRRTYRRLHTGWEWPHLVVERDEELLAGQRFYSFEPGIDPLRIQQVWTKEAGSDLWRPVEYGIGIGALNHYDSDADNERADPVRRWQRAEDNQYEVWPTPLKEGSILRMRGIAKPKELVADNDIVDIDDDLIALFVAGELLTRQKDPEAQLKLEQAAQHQLRLRAQTSGRATFPIHQPRAEWQGVSVRAPRT